MKKDNINKILKLIIIISVISTISLTIYYLFFFTDKQITCTLNGLQNSSVIVNQEFIDTGLTCTDLEDNDYSDYVSKNTNLDINTVGTYYIDYYFKYKNIKYEFRRNVIVTENPYKNVSIVVDTDTLYLIKGSEIKIPTYKVMNGTIETTSFYVDVTNNIDINNNGEYYIKYAINNNIQTVEKTVKVIVYDLDYTEQLSTTLKTKDDVIVTINITSDNYSYILLPDNTKSYDKNITYKVSKNGSYKFVIYDKYNNYKELNYNIDNIYSEYKCSVNINRNGTNGTLTVDRADEIKSYIWIIDGKEETGTSTYKNSRKAIDNISAKLVFNDNQKLSVNCTVNNTLVFKFKYDENNTKEFMTCKTYTSDDRTRLEKQLKDAVALAGYGTRAGVVEAARFLVGALDYKVPYLGPKTVNSALGRYAKEGLNIGNDKAWGCHVSGWTQGMDCTNFVNWAFKQNGLTSPGYSSSINAYNNWDKIKVGDLFYTPNSSKPSGYSHVGILIGKEGDTLYIAESTTGSTNAIVVTKWTKEKINSQKKFSVFHITSYPSEGNVTDMWVE